MNASAGAIHDASARVPERFHRDGAGEMGLAEPGAREDVERIDALLLAARDGEPGLARQRVAVTDDEVLEAVGKLELERRARSVAALARSGAAGGAAAQAASASASLSSPRICAADAEPRRLCAAGERRDHDQLELDRLPALRLEVPLDQRQQAHAHALAMERARADAAAAAPPPTRGSRGRTQASRA